MRALRLGCLIGAGLAVLGGVAAWRTLRYGFSTHEAPGRVEVAVARAARHWSVPASLRSAQNPLPLTPEVLSAATAHWADHCASCHGNDGKGRTTMGQRLYPRAPDMTLRDTQELTDGELFSAIENGIRLTAMPGWGEGTAESGFGSWALVHLVRHLPALSAAELEAMARLNPKSPEEWQALQEEDAFLEGNTAPPVAVVHPESGHAH